jgi:RNA ligase
MKLFEYIDKSQFDEMVALGYIKVVDHPSGCGHKLINYTKLCNSEKIWNPTTERCRGIVIDKDYNIIARPFKKFYNYEEYEDTSVIPTDEYFEVFENSCKALIYEKKKRRKRFK